ncbi:TetR/AcrR family transcriptional regulator [Spongiibacter taiwanensis]|uniref:TetR/AcrR family transcriptional regulator n=1 Tax=Spongiibacter taiwanensis TaxID=1748242 RepID=UPI002034DA49|nr:TetR/AcrR family transcriptional regulator [Spongiibacter taiwanensis]USA42503.1 TetR/AcrR family transcriptional regulator [Spongiibacter taiwanensis]
MAEQKISKRQKTRELILRVAAQQFSKYGFAGTSMDGLAKACKLTKGALYDHFGGKDDVYVQSLTAHFDQALDGLEVKTLGLAAAPVEERLLSFARNFVQLLSDDKVFRRLIIHWITDTRTSPSQLLVSGRIVKAFDYMVGLLQEYRPHLDARYHAYGFFCTAILAEDMRSVAEVLTPEVKSVKTAEGLLSYFRETLG